MVILADPEIKATIKMLVIGIFIGLIAGQLAWDRPEKQPDYVMTSDDRVIVVIQRFGKTAYIFTRYKENQNFEFESEMRPDSPYYPMPEKEIMGHKTWAFNPKFNEWISRWGKNNKVD